jgi:alkyldihydroxyacetonephosphate synthase
MPGVVCTAFELRVRRMGRRRKHWGWGFADEQPGADELRAAAAGLGEHLGYPLGEVEEPVALEAIDLPAPRIAAPDVCRAETDAFHRVRFGLGCSYADVVHGFRGQVAHPPDAVLFPRDEGELEAALEWADGANAAVIPVGGGTSVVGGIEPRVPERFDGAVSLSLAAFDALHELDVTSGAARLGAGLPGPAVEERLREHGLTMRFYPQSFELSTLGGWIVTRAGGHFATGPTHVDDLVESVRAITPAGVWESRRLPGSGAGPSPDRLLLGSEGTLGIVTEAWVRVQRRPEHRAGRTVRFARFEDGAEAVRAVVQSGLRPANCRLIEAAEARFTMAGDGSAHLLVLGFESPSLPVDHELAAALALCEQAGGEPDPPRDTGSSGAWRSAFLRAPYVRDTFVAAGVLSETFETAITWERFGALREAAVGAARRVLDDERATVTCRFTHAYPDGPAPYFTVLAPARRGEEPEQWWAVKRAVSDALIEAGGTITHHHAVGRDHRPWYDRQRPDLFAAALRGAKAAVDPRGLLNPGVLID